MRRAIVGHPGLGWRLTALAFAIVLIVGACGSNDPDDGPGAVDVSPTQGGAGPTTIVDVDQLDCERDAYPCSWAEAGPAAAARTDQLLAFSSLLLAEGATADELAGRLRGAAGVAEVISDAITVSFRVEGAIPVFVYVDPTEGGLIEGAVPPVAVADPVPGPPRPSMQAPGSQFTGCPPMTDARADGQPGPVGMTGEPKNALILGPWKWQMDWDVDTLTGLLQVGNSDYARPGGGVTATMTEDGDPQTADRPSAFVSTAEPAVRLEDFCGWERYETIIVKTHGRTVCEEARCHTSLSVGRFAETEDVLRAYAGGATGVTFGTSEYGNLLQVLTPAQVQACIERLEVDEPDPSAQDDCLTKLPSAGHLLITPDFFRANYAGGLKDRLIFLSACQGMKGGELARAIRGSGASSGGAILGFDKIIQTSISNRVLELFADWVGSGRAIDEDAVRKLNAIVDSLEGSADVAGQIEGDFTPEEMADVVPDGSGVTRGADIVSLHTERGGPELVDNGTVHVDGRTGDGDPDTLQLGARLTGVGEEGPEPYEIEIWLDDRRLSLEGVAWTGTDRDGEFDAEVVASVGQDLVPDRPVDLEIRVVLPDADGAISRWAYTNLDVGGEGTAVITIGAQTWEFVLADGRMGCGVSDDGSELTAYGTVDDTYEVTFSAGLHPYGVGTTQRLSGPAPAAIQVMDDASHEVWMADPTNPVGMEAAIEAIPGGASQVDSLTIDGSHAWGTATFIERQAVRKAWGTHGPLPDPVPGTFDIRCAG